MSAIEQALQKYKQDLSSPPPCIPCTPWERSQPLLLPLLPATWLTASPTEQLHLGAPLLRIVQHSEPRSNFSQWDYVATTKVVSWGEVRGNYKPKAGSLIGLFFPVSEGKKSKFKLFTHSLPDFLVLPHS